MGRPKSSSSIAEFLRVADDGEGSEGGINGRPGASENENATHMSTLMRILQGYPVSQTRGSKSARHRHGSGNLICLLLLSSSLLVIMISVIDILFAKCDLPTWF